MPRLFGDKLRLLRTRAGQTQVDVAAALGDIKQSHIANLEAGRDVASLDLIIRAARHFAVSLDYLLREDVAVESAVLATPPLTAPNSPLPFGRKLRALRDAHNWSQGQLARQLRLARGGYISNLEAGRKQPSPELATQIADLFGVSLDALLRDEIHLPEEK